MPHPGQLVSQLIRHFRPVSLILIEHYMAEGWRSFVEGDGPMGRFDIGNCLEQHRSKTVNRANFSGTRGQRAGPFEGMKSAVNDGIAIEYNEAWFTHGDIITKLTR